MSIAILPMSSEYNWNPATVGLIQSSFFLYVEITLNWYLVPSSISNDIVLKEKPKVNDFSYEELVNGNIKVNFNVFDNDSVIEKLKVVVNDYSQKDDLEEEKVYISFNVEDNDNALISEWIFTLLNFSSCIPALL